MIEPTEVVKIEIKKPEDKNNLTEAEKKHIPIIEILNGKVTVKVGEITHPMTQEHYITYIELFSDEESIAKKELTPEDSPEAVFEEISAKDIKARANCNIHGLWESL